MILNNQNNEMRKSPLLWAIILLIWGIVLYWLIPIGFSSFTSRFTLFGLFLATITIVWHLIGFCSTFRCLKSLCYIKNISYKFSVLELILPSTWFLVTILTFPSQYTLFFEYKLIYFVFQLFLFLFWAVFWLYGVFNWTIVLSSYFIKNDLPKKKYDEFKESKVVGIYPTYNDFNEDNALALESMINQTHKRYRVIVADDSTDENYIQNINNFVNELKIRYPEMEIDILRRPELHKKQHKGKAGNLNYVHVYLKNDEEYILLSDKDEIFPSNFIEEMLPYFASDEIAFLQANHVHNPAVSIDSNFSRDLGLGVDIHWEHYQSPRNKYGFVMLLGHGVIYRKSIWEKISWEADGRRGKGWPEVVSEDLAATIEVRQIRDVIINFDAKEIKLEKDAFRQHLLNGKIKLAHQEKTCLSKNEAQDALKVLNKNKSLKLIYNGRRATARFLNGYFGHFIKNIKAVESFPPDYRAFITRHKKWCGGTIELIRNYFKKIWFSSMTIQEKLDVTIPIFNLLLSIIFLVYLLWILIYEFYMPTGLGRIVSHRFLIITILTLFSPVIPFIIEMFKTPIKLWKFICHSTLFYPSLAFLTLQESVAIILGKEAKFLRTSSEIKSQLLLKEILLPSNLLLTFIAGIILSLISFHDYPFTIVITSTFILSPFLIWWNEKTLRGKMIKAFGLFPFNYMVLGLFIIIKGPWNFRHIKEILPILLLICILSICCIIYNNIVRRKKSKDKIIDIDGTWRYLKTDIQKSLLVYKLGKINGLM